ncbi:MAG: 4-hydroxy-tetrahydrodipicolinate reductase [Bacteroidales bacterium]|jgi:4-hydroxy-tetrahydrodipicolinate reductase|nr:4-hydroxy-tetrahydrodipicolinate reductase [Bacteroidales bacterium]
MKLGVIGYGKMGKTIECLAPQYGFSSFVVVDNEDDWNSKIEHLKECDVALEFSMPQTVVANLLRCFEHKLPVVSGTTGLKKKEELLNLWQNNPVSFIYGSNFSIGANIFFKLNESLAKQMSQQQQYAVFMEETHHIHKKDIPSGTALTIEQGIISQINHLQKIPIISHRENEVVGVHLVSYNSVEDYIQIKHVAHTREAFAHGALKAAVWLVKNPGVYAFEEVFGKI